MSANAQVRQAVANAVAREQARNSLVALLGWPNGGIVADAVESWSRSVGHSTQLQALELCRVFLLHSPDDMLGREPAAIIEAFTNRLEQGLG